MSPAKPSATILVVDDEADICESLAMVLDLAGYRALTATNGPDALRILRSEHPDLIVSDQRMPGMDGLQVLAAAEQIQPGIPKVLMTAFPKLELAVSAINDVALDKFLIKPILPDAFVGIIASLLGQRSHPTVHA